jgi:hypothetical protein
MNLSIQNFQDLQQHMPLLASCVHNQSLIDIQNIFDKSALKTVIVLIDLEKARSYDWDPEAEYKELELKTSIRNYLQIPDEKSVTPEHLFYYLKYNEI